MPAPQPARIPTSTYRLQFNRRFAFPDATALVPYLSKLGITECYCSPLLAARAGSSHGYDICDHKRLNPELGRLEDFDAFSSARAAYNLGLILDFVPNHMSIDPAANPWWRSVLENGPSSPFAHFFDIDWDPVKSELKGKLLLPILDDQYGIALESGQIQVDFENGVFSLRYLGHHLPLSPKQQRILLRHHLEPLEAELGPEDPALKELLSILFQLDHMPAYTETDPAAIADRQREKEVAQERLARLAADSARIRQHLEQNVRQFNGKPGQPDSFNLLHELLEAQPYRLSSWRTALHEINYRRFFDINDLAALRMEHADVFAATHALLFAMIREGIVSGVRLDHVDGLFDPAEYFQQLAAGCPDTNHVYIVAEKIISPGEPLRDDWTVHGTTGYGFLNDLTGLFIDTQNAQKFRRLYERFAGERRPFSDVVYESKKLIITTSMASELNVLALELNRISEGERRFRDFTLPSIQEALREVVACFPVYRTYFSPRGWSEFDQRAIETAVRRALRRNPAMEASIFEFIRQMLLPAKREGLPEEEYQRRVRFAMKFQQYTGPVHAKGLEDTAFYCYSPLLSLNEVGGDPSRFGRPPGEFHESNLRRLRAWPLAMLATATHDAKRGEDARARLNVLSEIPDEWRAHLSRWSRANAGMRTLVDGSLAPDRRDEYLFYQALVGAWPVDDGSQPDPALVERMRQYMEKATKEAKVHTSWIHPSEPYDAAVADFVRRTLTGERAKRFLALLLPFEQRIARLGAVNSLSQLVLKVASPGVPDFYQGTELWDFSLVDPDNRRTVDYGRRRRLLDDLEPLLAGSCAPERVVAAVAEMLEHWQDGRIKLYVTAAGLRLRRSFPKLFLEGDYVPLHAEGSKKNHVVGFARSHDGKSLIAMAPRLLAGLTSEQHVLPLGGGSWGDTRIILPAGSGAYRNTITGQRILPAHEGGQHHLRLAEVLDIFPAGLLLEE